MKKLLLLLLSVLVFACTDYTEDFNTINGRLDKLEQTLPSIDEQIASINAQLASLKEIDNEIKEQISDLEKNGNATATEISNLKAKDSALEKSISNLQSYVDTQIANAKSEATAAYATIEQYNTIVAQLSTLQSSTNVLGEELTAKINAEVKTLTDKIADLETRLEAVEEKVEDLLARIQSVSYIPRYEDGKATVEYNNSISRVTLDFEVSPKDAITELAKVWQEAISVKAVYTESRAVSFIDMPIIEFNADATNGVISVTASGENLSQEFFDGTTKASARLAISDGNNSVTSDYISLVATEIMPYNEIWYTNGSTTKPTTPYDKTAFGANIVSNTYDSEKECWVLKFDGDVTSIGYGAFANCRSLTSITIPNSVTSIGERAFVYCDLTSITIPDSVTSIGSYAFLKCSSLTSFYGKFASKDNCCLIVNGVLNSFAIGCGLTEYTIPNSVTRIDSQVFDSCISLTSVTIPDSVTSISGFPFINCNNLISFYGKFTSADNRCLIVNGKLHSFAPAGLTEYTIPDGVTSIERYAFRDCTSLTSIKIPDSVTTIRDYVFEGCSSLTSVTIGNSVTLIDSYAFWHCSSLTSVTIPNSVTSIGHGVFAVCESLVSFYGKFASEDNRCLVVDGILKSFAPAGLTEYTIPNSVTSIEKYTFYSCDSLTSVTIGNSITSIGYQAFWSCSSLTSITIPNSVTSIGERAFYNCSSLTSVYCKPTTPPTGGSNMFYDNASGRKIYVPTASVEAYKSAKIWSGYASYIEGYNF